MTIRQSGGLRRAVLEMAAFAGLSVSVATAQGRQGATDSSEVAKAVEAYHAAASAGDSTAMLALLDEDAVILESGGMETRAEFRSHHLAADIAFVRAVQSVRSPIRVRTRGDAAWATSTTTAQGTVNGRAVNSAGAELMVLARTPAGWKITAIHWSSRSRRTP
jgi:ketosteroid isomerase-like protein